MTVNQKVMFLSADFVIKTLHQNGDVLLKSVNKNLNDILVKEQYTKHIYKMER